jgi:hypothetical protein
MSAGRVIRHFLVFALELSFRIGTLVSISFCRFLAPVLFSLSCLFSVVLRFRPPVPVCVECSFSDLPVRFPISMDSPPDVPEAWPSIDEGLGALAVGNSAGDRVVGFGCCGASMLSVRWISSKNGTSCGGLMNCFVNQIKQCFDMPLL